MEKHEAMMLFCLAGLVVKGTGETVENFLADAEKWAEGIIPLKKSKGLELGQEMVLEADILDAVNQVYKAYPAKCPNRGTSTGKCAKDKSRIYFLMTKQGWHAQGLIDAINKYVNEVQSARGYLKNFSTFLNNIPLDEPDEVELDQMTDIWQG